MGEILGIGDIHCRSGDLDLEHMAGDIGDLHFDISANCIEIGDLEPTAGDGGDLELDLSGNIKSFKYVSE